MTTQEKLVNRKLSTIELAEFLKNVSQACRINGVSRQHFYDIKKAYDEHGIEGLKEKSRRKPWGYRGYRDVHKYINIWRFGLKTDTSELQNDRLGRKTANLKYVNSGDTILNY